MLKIKTKFSKLLAQLELEITNDHRPKNIKGEPLPLTVYAPTFGELYNCESFSVMQKEDLIQVWYSDRGQSHIVFESTLEDDVLYYLFNSIILSLVSTFESHNRKSIEDYDRSALFTMQEDLMGKLSAEWKLKLKKNHQELLKQK